MSRRIPWRDVMRLLKREAELVSGLLAHWIEVGVRQ